MSLLLEAGHVDAPSYTIGRVHDEAGLVEQRQSALLATQMALTQNAIASIMSKDARRAFTKDLKSLSITSRPKNGLFEHRG